MTDFFSLFNHHIHRGIEVVVQVGHDTLLPAMCLVFGLAMILRMVIYLTVKAESAFAYEFEKRVHKHLADPNYEPGITSFHELTRKILERTHLEHYNLKRKHRRRRFDQITSLTDRVFLIVEGANRLVSDTLSQTKYLRKDGQPPRFLDIAKFVFESNPVFNRVLGLFPLGMFNDLLNILPGLFVVAGIFGTFLGVMGALPTLSQIDIGDATKTKEIMDAFLLKMAFSMGASSVGILFSVIITVVNAMLNPEGIYYAMVNKFTSALEFLWNDTTNNEVKEDVSFTTDRRAVAFSNLSVRKPAAESKAVEPMPVVAAAPVSPMPAPVVMAERIQPPPPKAPPPPPVYENTEDPFDVGDLTPVFDRMDQALAQVEGGGQPEADGENVEDRLAVLRHRLGVLDNYLEKADEDRSTGLMSEEMWKDETEAYREERQKVEAQIRELEQNQKAA